MTFSIIGARIEIDGLHVATLHRPLDYGMRDQLTGWLDLGASIDPETLKKGRDYDADMDNLEARLDEAEDEAREANARARAAEEEAEGYLEALRAIAFAFGENGGALSHAQFTFLINGLPEEVADALARGYAARKA